MGVALDGTFISAVWALDITSFWFGSNNTLFLRAQVLRGQTSRHLGFLVIEQQSVLDQLSSFGDAL